MGAGNDGQVVTRFAPSPTGFLHIGGARTALFNWLFARHHGGRFLLRIEDTDRARSTEEATQAIFDGLRWLGLDWDGEAVSQFSRAGRHREVAEQLLDRGLAYKCFSTAEEIAAAREKAKAAGEAPIFLSPWRERSDHPDAPYAIRLKAPREGETVVEDAVQGPCTWQNGTLDDLILLRSDGTPTYMLAVVVDDHDMGVSHVIRGDDHLTNAARQSLIFQAMDWPVPVFAHIPLIHGPDGAKLSKRHGALGIEAYRDMGFPSAALRNYLARLGWSHGDEEFFSTEQAVAWFGLEAIGKSPARLDLQKLASLSGQHIRAMPDAALVEALVEHAAAQQSPIDDPTRREWLSVAMPALKERAKTVAELYENAYFILAERPLDFDEEAAATLAPDSRTVLSELTSHLQKVDWSRAELEAQLRQFAEDRDLKFGKVAQPVRAALTGRAASPGVFDVLTVLGKDESIARLEDALRVP
ncbi:MAG: glutamate--tRNA ligase [Pseudomonadota bacterium]